MIHFCISKTIWIPRIISSHDELEYCTESLRNSLLRVIQYRIIANKVVAASLPYLLKVFASINHNFGNIWSEEFLANEISIQNPIRINLTSNRKMTFKNLLNQLIMFEH